LKIILKAENILSKPEIIISTNEISKIPHYESLDSFASTLTKNSPLKQAKNQDSILNDLTKSKTVNQESINKNMSSGTY
jgi:hypothetical protein